MWMTQRATRLSELVVDQYNYKATRYKRQHKAISWKTYHILYVKHEGKLVGEDFNRILLNPPKTGFINHTLKITKCFLSILCAVFTFSYVFYLK